MTLVTPASFIVATFCSASVWNRNSLPIRRAGSPVQSSRGPRIANETPARCSSSATAREMPRARSSNEPGASDPVQVLGGGAVHDRHVQPIRPVGALRLRDPPRVGAVLQVAHHRARLGREARLAHHQRPAEVDDRVHVLDVHGALLHARAARGAGPDDVVVDDARNERDLVERLAGGEHLQDVRPFVEQVIAQVHDQQLRGERLAPCSMQGRRSGSGRTRCTRRGRAVTSGSARSSSAAPSDCSPDSSFSMSIGSGSQRAARPRAREPHVDGARDDVEVLRVRQVDEEPQHERDVRPEEEPREERCQPSLIHVNRCETAVEIGVHADGYSDDRPAAIRAPRIRNSVRMIQVIRPRIR